MISSLWSLWLVDVGWGAWSERKGTQVVCCDWLDCIMGSSCDEGGQILAVTLGWAISLALSSGHKLSLQYQQQCQMGAVFISRGRQKMEKLLNVH